MKRDCLLVLLCQLFLYPSVSWVQVTKWIALYYRAVTVFFPSSLTPVDQSYRLQSAPLSLRKYTLKACFVFPQEVFIQLFSNNMPFLERQRKRRKGKDYFKVIGYISASGMKAFKMAILCTERKQLKTLRLFFISVEYAFFTVCCWVMNGNSGSIIVAMKHMLWVIDRKLSMNTIKLWDSSLECAISNRRQNSWRVEAFFCSDRDAEQMPPGPLVAIKQSEDVLCIANKSWRKGGSGLQAQENCSG